MDYNKKVNPALRSVRGGVAPLQARANQKASQAKPLSNTKLAVIVAAAVKAALKD